MQPFKYNPEYHSGRFNKKITFQLNQETENAMGDTVTDWVDVKVMWAMVKTTKGREYIQAAAVQGENTVRFVTRYTTGLTNDMRIVYKGRTFEIIAPPINDDELDKTLTIMAKEVMDIATT